MVSSFKSHGLSQLEIADESMMQLLAGSDTTATIIRTGFASILTNPSIYAKLISEITNTDIGLDRVIGYRESLKLPYLMACIKEALRHNPAATGLLPRVVGKEGDYFNGYFIPPGTEVAISAWKMHRLNTSIYGADAALFRPERWLEASPEKLAVMDDAHHLVFGAGRYKCMGENIARVELGKVFFELLRRFEWQVSDGMKVMESSKNYGLFIQKGMWVRVSERE
jgi:cytochrome P450